MLDSLVRVSRRVGGAAKGVAKPRTAGTIKQLRAGKLVLANLGDWGWWPAVVHQEPGTGRLAKGERGVRKVRVAFVDENSTWAWVEEKNLRKFTGREVGEDDYEEQQEAFSRARRNSTGRPRTRSQKVR